MGQTKISKLTDNIFYPYRYTLHASNYQINMNLYVMCSIPHEEIPATKLFSPANYYSHRFLLVALSGLIMNMIMSMIMMFMHHPFSIMVIFKTVMMFWFYQLLGLIPTNDVVSVNNRSCCILLSLILILCISLSKFYVQFQSGLL